MNEPNRRILRTTVMSLSMLCAIGTVTRAQDPSWPLPSRAPNVYVGLQYGHEAFERVYRPMHLGTAYGAVENERGAVYVKLTRGRRFGTTGHQAEAEVYPILGSGYGYVAYAYGEVPTFPRHRIGAEYFRGLPWSLEASLGLRHYRFAFGSVTLVTGSVSYYRGNGLYTIRPFVAVDAPRTSVALLLSGRHYLSDDGEFVFARIGGGISPDERWIQAGGGVAGQDLQLLRSQQAGAGVQWLMAQKVLATASIDLRRQEVAFQAGTYVTNISVSFGVRFAL